MNARQGRRWDFGLSSSALLAAALMLLLSAIPGFARAEPVSLDAAPVSVLTIPQGQSLLMRYPEAKRVAAGDGNIVDVKVFEDTREILVLGKKEGITDLRIWSRDGSTIAYLVRVLGIPDPMPAPPGSALEVQSTILIKAKLIEVKKTALRDIGVDWADIAAGPVFGTLDEFVTNEYFRVVPEGIEGLSDLPLELGTNNH
jgi:pilus assembly protein CpaC